MGSEKLIELSQELARVLEEKKKLESREAELLKNIAREAGNTEPEQPMQAHVVEPKKVFPATRKTTQDRILWLLRETFKKPATISDIENEYAKYDPLKIYNRLRGMVQSGEIVKGKLDGNNRIVYYGLPDWVEGTGKKKRWKEKYIPEGTGTAQWDFPSNY